MGNKIILLSYHDYAGSGYRIAEAISLNSKNYVIPIIIFPVEFPKKLKRMHSIVKSDKKGKGIFFKDDIERIQAIIDDADIIHFKGDEVPSHSLLMGNITIPSNTPLIVTVHGSMFRRSQSEKVSAPLSPVEEYLEKSDLRTAGDPCLNYPEFDAIFTPAPFDFTGIVKTWKPTSNVITHSPTSREKKGTHYLIDAVKSLNKKGYNVKLDIIENTSYKESIERKKNSILFFDQSEAGYYGNSAIEAMAYGIPVACRLAKEAFKWSNGRITPDCPIINTMDNIEKAIANYLELSTLDKLNLSTRTFIYAKKIHSYKAVGTMWSEIYNKLLSNQFKKI